MENRSSTNASLLSMVGEIQRELGRTSARTEAMDDKLDRQNEIADARNLEATEHRHQLANAMQHVSTRVAVLEDRLAPVLPRGARAPAPRLGERDPRKFWAAVGMGICTFLAFIGWIAEPLFPLVLEKIGHLIGGH